MLFYLASLGLFSTPKDCDYERWFKKLTPSADVVGIFAEKLPTISGIGPGMIQDSIGPFGDIFLTLVISDKDSIACLKIVKGDSALLPKVTSFLSCRTITSAEVNKRKVYSLYSFRLQFIPETNIKKRRKRRFKF